MLEQFLLLAVLCLMVGGSIGFLVLAGMTIMRNSLPPAAPPETSTGPKKDLVDGIIERAAKRRR